jgi:leucyl-tRNA synthetase
VFVERATGAPVVQIVAKMSKSLKNVVNPDEVIAQFGADTFRLYEMYMGPLDASKPWNTRDIVGLFRFLQRVWRLVIDEETGAVVVREAASAEVERQLHRTIAKVGEDVERLQFNTAIASMFELVNLAHKEGGVTREQADRFVRCLSPFAPHIAEELGARLGMAAPVSLAAWPSHDPAMLVDSEIEIPVQITGKVRSRIVVAADADAATLERAALADAKVIEFLAGKQVRKVVVVPGKMVNIVAG